MVDLFSLGNLTQPNIIGKLPSGRPIVRNADGSISTHRNAIVNFDKDFYIIPTLFGGKQYSVDDAVNIIKKNNFTDPDTGELLPIYGSQEEAEQAENQGHSFLNEIAMMLSKGGQ